VYVALTAVSEFLNKTIHANDALAPVYQAQYGIEAYFDSALRQVEALNALCLAHLGAPVTALTAIADFACHYGRLLRALRATAPDTALIACDIDREALDFCAKEFRAQAFYSAWSPSTLVELPTVDLLVCVSLLTHTRHSFFMDTLHLWERMVRPGGLLVFTFLGKGFIQSWEAGQMAHYGPATPADIIRVSQDFAASGHAFHSYPTPYSETEYGVGFLSEDVILDALRAHGGFELLEIRPGPNNEFGQDVAVVRRRAKT
jgi:SAM-dependent methyltransferase